MLDVSKKKLIGSENIEKLYLGRLSMFLKNKFSILVLALVLVLKAQLVFANDVCATTERELRGSLAVFNTTEEWVETTAGDKRPLRAVVTSNESQIFLSFEKSDARILAQPSTSEFFSAARASEYTLWGEGPIKICQDGQGYKIEFLSGVMATTDAPGIMRSNFRAGARMNLRMNSASNIRISAGLWNSNLVPAK
jgi:hypothetical protein